MDITSLLVEAISGAVGGNVAGAAMKEKSLGTVGNSIAGIVGGGIGGTILQTVLGSAAAGGGGMDMQSILANVGGGGRVPPQPPLDLPSQDIGQIDPKWSIPVPGDVRE